MSYLRLHERAGNIGDLRNANAELKITHIGSDVTFVLTGWGKRLAKLLAHHPLTGYSGAWIVDGVMAVGGFGPLIYDVAIEWCTLNGGGLTSDRTSVSPEARNVWKYYANKRPDVTSHQLDDDKNTLTKTHVDNAGMHAASIEDNDDAFASFDAGHADWKMSPLSKRFTKQPTTLQQLKQSGILRESVSVSLRSALDPASLLKFLL